MGALCHSEEIKYNRYCIQMLITLRNNTCETQKSAHLMLVRGSMSCEHQFEPAKYSIYRILQNFHKEETQNHIQSEPRATATNAHHSVDVGNVSVTVTL